MPSHGDLCLVCLSVCLSVSLSAVRNIEYLSSDDVFVLLHWPRFVLMSILASTWEGGAVAGCTTVTCLRLVVSCSRQSTHSFAVPSFRTLTVHAVSVVFHFHFIPSDCFAERALSKSVFTEIEPNFWNEQVEMLCIVWISVCVCV